MEEAEDENQYEEAFENPTPQNITNFPDGKEGEPGFRVQVMFPDCCIDPRYAYELTRLCLVKRLVPDVEFHCVREFHVPSFMDVGDTAYEY